MSLKTKRKRKRDHLVLINKYTSERQKMVLIKQGEIIKKGYTWVNECDWDMIESVTRAAGGIVCSTASRNGKIRLHPVDKIINGRLRTGNIITEFIMNNYSRAFVIAALLFIVCLFVLTL